MQPYEVHPLLAAHLASLNAPAMVKERLDRHIRRLAAGELAAPRERDRVDRRCLVHFAFFPEGGAWHAFKLWIDDQSRPGVWLF